MKSKKIKFVPRNELHGLAEAPVPAHTLIPAWYKNLKQDTGIFAPTAKMCVPLLDALTTGYFLTLPCDIFTHVDQSGERVFHWRPNIETEWITRHHKEQITGIHVPLEYDEQPFKFTGSWGLKMPKGYSALFVHPLTRYDLPFLSMTAVVDSDLYYAPVNVPFFIKKDFVGMLEKGTPYAQVIPVKRSHFHGVKVSPNKYKVDLFLNKISFYSLRWYKQHIWQAKRFR